MRRVAILSFSAVAAACSAFGSSQGDAGTTSNVGDASSDRGDASMGADGSFDAGDGRHFVFVTSGKFAGNEVADERCMAHARTSMLAGRHFKGWFSTSQSAKARLKDFGPWYTTADAGLVVTDWDHLLVTHEQPINFDENGAPVDVETLVWTGTLGTGEPKSTCAEWTSIDSFGTAGLASDVTKLWTTVYELSCVGNYHLYCFEQP